MINIAESTTNCQKKFRGNFLSEFKITNFNFICTFFCRSRNYSNATGRQQKKETQVLKDDRTNKSNFFNAFKPVYFISQISKMIRPF